MDSGSIPTTLLSRFARRVAPIHTTDTGLCRIFVWPWYLRTPRLRETLHTANEILGADAFGEPDVAYTPDPELDFAIDDAEGLLKALTDGPVLVAGNSLVN